MAFINDLELPDGCENINLLMTGYIGSGKSSFANTLKSVFNNTGEIASPAATYGITSSSVTRKVKNSKGKYLFEAPFLRLKVFF